MEKMNIAKTDRIREFRSYTVGVIAPEFPDQKYIQDRYIDIVATSPMEAIDKYKEHRDIRYWLREDEKHLVGIVKQAPHAERWTIPVPISIDEEFIHDIMCTAFEGGINYWCDKARYVKEPTEEVEFMSESITKGAIVKLHLLEGPIDDSEQTWYEIDLLKFLRGLQMFWVEQSEKAGGMMDVDSGNFDAELADMVIQYAVFGEVVFG